MNDRFIDTNVLVYAIGHDVHRRAIAGDNLSSGGVISVQVLNEAAHVYRPKMRFEHAEIIRNLSDLRATLQVVSVTVPTHELGLTIMERYRYSVYDSMIIASALEAGCSTLLTEDLAAGQVLEGRLTVVNPFRQPG